MKYLVLLCDGMADYAIDEFGGKTPLEAAYTPNMNKLSKKSKIGLVKTVQDSMKPGSDVANLSVLGYDPMIYYTGLQLPLSVTPGTAGSFRFTKRLLYRYHGTAALFLYLLMPKLYFESSLDLMHTSVDLFKYGHKLFLKR